jgi:hypothetical protein
MVPSAVEHILSEECRLLDSFHYLSEFGEDLKVNLEKRVKEIEVDKILQRRAHLRNEVCCYFSLLFTYQYPVVSLTPVHVLLCLAFPGAEGMEHRAAAESREICPGKPK